MNILILCVYLGLARGADDPPGGTNFNGPLEQCGRHEVWTSCTSSSCFEKVCGVPTTDICTRDCKRGCKCAPGFARNRLGVCINETSCPRTCGENEMWTACGSSNCFEARCGAARPTSCDPNCNMGCKCADGYARSLDRCVEIARCPPPSFAAEPTPCPDNEEYTSCSSSSCFEHRCDTKPTDICTRDCRRGCKCKTGYARKDTRCVLETTCPPRTDEEPGFRSLQFPAPGGKTAAPSAQPKHRPQFWTGKKAEKAEEHEDGNRTVYVASKMGECVTGEGECLLTRYVPMVPFLGFVKSIKGFDFKPGFNYELFVISRRKGALKKLVEYDLIKILNKTEHKAWNGKGKGKGNATWKGLLGKGKGNSTQTNCVFPAKWEKQKQCCKANPQHKNCQKTAAPSPK